MKKRKYDKFILKWLAKDLNWVGLQMCFLKEEEKCKQAAEVFDKGRFISRQI